MVAIQKPDQTKLVAPDSETKMAAPHANTAPTQPQPPEQAAAPAAPAPPEPGPKLVRIKLLRDARAAGEIQKAGWEGDVTEEEAADLCKPIQGQYKFSGERQGVGSDERHDMSRAKRI